MTTTELQAEYRYRYLERLGMMCEDQEPTPAQREYAREEALKEVETLTHEQEIHDAGM